MGLTSRSGNEAKIFHHEITSSLATSTRVHGRTPRNHSRGTRPVDFLSSRSRVARRLRPVDWTVKLRPETVARGPHARRRGRKDKWDRKKRAFLLKKYFGIHQVARESVMNSLSWESFCDRWKKLQVASEIIKCRKRGRYYWFLVSIVEYWFIMCNDIYITSFWIDKQCGDNDDYLHRNRRRFVTRRVDTSSFRSCQVRGIRLQTA